MKFCVFSNDPLYKYRHKGEVKPRYWNPDDLFDEVHVFSFCDRDIAPAEVQELAGRARLRIIPLGYPGPFRLWRQYRQALRELRAIQPDLIRAHNPWHAGAIAVRAAKTLGIPVVLSLHTHYGARRRWEGRWLLQGLRLLEWYSLSRADRVWCVSEYLKGYARQMGARVVEVIYNRVYAAQFQGARQALRGRPLILSVGRLDPPKDQECLIRAVQGLNAELELVGDGANRGHLERLASDLGLAEQVRFVGAVPHDHIQDYYAQADFFAMATGYEGFCIPVLEAMAAGLPVVACDTDPLPEILGGQGLVVPRRPESFRQAFSWLMANPAQALALGQQARARALILDGPLMETREAALYIDMIAQRASNTETQG